MLTLRLFILIVIGLSISLSAFADKSIQIELDLLQSMQKAELFIQEKAFEQALYYNDVSLTISQSINISEHQWRQYEQRARILEALNKDELAIDFWQQSVIQLSYIQSLPSIDQALQQSMQKTRLNYIKRLLNKGDDQQTLSQLVEAWEGFKKNQMENYLGQLCVIPDQSIRPSLRENKKIAVIYPISVENHIEMMVEVAGVIHHVKLHHSLNRIVSLTRRLNVAIRQVRPEYRRYAKALYSILLRPVVSLLNNTEVNTLVWVQNESIQGLPLAALQDKNGRFLIQDYAVAIVPAIQLLSNEAKSPDTNNTLIAGVSKAVEYDDKQFSALPAVIDEVNWFRQHFQAKSLLDEAFDRQTLMKELKANDFDIIHLASHVEIGKTLKKSYLLTGDGAVSLSELQTAIGLRQFSSYPVELLAFSACQTAAETQGATLGLSGLLVQSGVRSVLASLWPVDDAAASAVMKIFYSNWDKHRNNKARSLQLALQSMLHSDYEHPFYWSGFVLIGHWE